MSKRLNAAYFNEAYVVGPPIEKCPTYEAMVLDAQMGSQSLLRAIRRAGVRP